MEYLMSALLMLLPCNVLSWLDKTFLVLFTKQEAAFLFNTRLVSAILPSLFANAEIS